MRFLVYVYAGDQQGYENGAMPPKDLLEKMGKFNEELVNAGVMLGGDGLHPTKRATQIKFYDGKQTITKGPFKGSVSGYWLWKVANEEEALAWAKKAPMEDGATLEIRKAFEPEDFGPEVAKQERALQNKMEKQK